jgi:hypothetical protein
MIQRHFAENTILTNDQGLDVSAWLIRLVLDGRSMLPAEDAWQGLVVLHAAYRHQQ